MTIDQAPNKVTRTYSFDADVVAWVTQFAARKTINGEGRRISDSEVANDILTAAMEADIREEAHKRNLLDAALKHKVK